MVWHEKLRKQENGRGVFEITADKGQNIYPSCPIVPMTCAQSVDCLPIDRKLNEERGNLKAPALDKRRANILIRGPFEYIPREAIFCFFPTEIIWVS